MRAAAHSLRSDRHLHGRHRAATTAIAALALWSFGCTTAPGKAPFRINYNTELAEDPAVAAVLQASLANFLDAVARGDLGTQHITLEHQEQHQFFTATLRALAVKPNTDTPAPLILKSYSPNGDNYLITVAFFRATDGAPQINKILEFYAYRNGNGFRFQSPFDYRNSLPTHTANGVTFHANAPFNSQRAEEFVRFKSQFEQLLRNQPEHLDYFCFHSLDELLKAHGILYDVNKCNSLAQDLGFPDNNGRCFLTGTGDERYIFGYLQGYLRRHCNQTGDLYSPFVNGMAAYYGGYSLSGDDMPTLKRQFRDRLKAEPDFDFLREFKLGRGSSINRHFTFYVICALLCEEVVTHGSFDQAMELAHCGPNGEEFFARIHEILGVDESGFHELIVRLIRA